MKPLMRMEFYRAFHNPLLLLSLGIFVTHVLPLGAFIDAGGYPLTVFQHWIGGENTSVWPVMFYLTAPILGAMPHLRTMYLDRKEGYVKNIFVRTPKVKYYLAKYIVTFVTAGLVTLWPLVLNFCATALVLPATIPQGVTGLYPVSNLSMWSELFYTYPFTYLLLYGGLNFVFFGLLVTLGLLAGFVVDNEFLVVLSPFMVYLIVYGVTQLTGTYGYCPFGFLRPSQPVVTSPGIVLGEIAFLVGIGGVFACVSANTETF